MPDSSPLSLPFSLDLSAPLEHLQTTGSLTLVHMGNAAAKCFVVGQILRSAPVGHVFWASNDADAGSLQHVAGLLLPLRVHLIKPQLTLRDYYQVLMAFAEEAPSLFLFEDFASVSAQPLPSQAEILAGTQTLRVGQTVRPYKLFDTLERYGYRPAVERVLQPGEYVRRGDSLFLAPLQSEVTVRVDLFGEEVESITEVDLAQLTDLRARTEVDLYPGRVSTTSSTLLDVLGRENREQQATGGRRSLFIADDIADDTEELPLPEGLERVTFTSFPPEDSVFFHLNYFSVLPYYTLPDFIVDIKERFHREFAIVIMTKKHEEIEHLLRENQIMYSEDTAHGVPSTVTLIKLAEEAFMPHSFQNASARQLLLTDREIFQFHRSSKAKKAIKGMNTEMLSKLKPGDYVIHVAHGVAHFDGIVRREVADMGVREYLKLEYAGSDKLFVPVESAEKLTKFIGDEHPKLTKLNSSEWQKIQKKINAETEKIAGELLKLYAAREMSTRRPFSEGDEKLREFCESFRYELTPGQAQTWYEIERDMQGQRPMDRLVCGDVGFGKTEMAMRAAFKCFTAGRQCAILAPITILAEQHYENFLKRITGKSYGVEIALLSRFQTAAEQQEILRRLKLGMVDIVIGTHRLLSKDIQFHDLGLLIIDEEQRFGVKQKEHLKHYRNNVDLLTLTATPIPRTLNMSLSKLKDISTITTPPPGRLPVVTEVRRFNLHLIRERILFEVERGGQVYFLHNEVRTIEALSEQLRALCPEVSFLTAHGQMSPQLLEERIKSFKNKEAQVLIASTIIENGIDLDNANTLIVNRAEQFGLSQLYQLRGRVGRGRTQAYSYFLYHGQRLEIEARKRLRAIVEASELGSGFQIAMRDLEIRGAGEILGANQSGAMQTVGVSHFMRMLQRTMEKMQSGEITEQSLEQDQTITVEVPLSAYIPAEFIPDANEKIQVYQELAGAESLQHLSELKAELREDYGRLPAEVENLCKVVALKLTMRDANLSGVRIRALSSKSHELTLRMGSRFNPGQILQLLQHSKSPWVVSATALKLQFTTLPLTWYDALLQDIQYLLPSPEQRAVSASAA
ncbi:transcription-repair coupling factor [Candidatus Peribacteria bacterium]|nr:transcription-repair coupling factor [Candidatus Peribacteria bacterium]